MEKDTELHKRIGRRIKQARESLGLTQEDLARAISRVTGQPTSATKISYFETGARRAHLEDLRAFSQVLAKPLDFFLSETELVPRSDSNLRAVLFRATRTLNPRAQREVDDVVDDVILNEPVRRGSVLSLVPRRTPAEILQVLEVTGPPVDVAKVANASGISVHRRALDDSIWGMVVLIEGHMAIVINKELYPEHRQRFAAAHELGHLWLGHYPQDVPELSLNLEHSYHTSPIDSVMERQADQFAAELLMPEEWLTKHWRSCSGDLDVVCRLYQVSPQLMWMRLVEIGLVRGELVQ